MNSTKLFFIVLLICSITISSFAQTSHEYPVEELTQLATDISAGTYDEYILSTSGGAYAFQAYVNISTNAVIKGKEGLAEKPVLSCPGNTSASFGIFRTSGASEKISVSLENLKVDNSLELGMVIRIDTETDFYVKNCHMYGNTNSSGLFRINVAGGSVSIENSLFTDCKQRLIHYYTTDITYGPVLIKNSSFSNIAGPVLYYRSAGTVAIGTDATIDHCTFDNITGAEGVFKFRNMTGTVSVKNSIFNAVLGTLDAAFVTGDYCYVNGFETIPVATNSIETAPVFADAANYNFTLTNFDQLTAGDLQILGDLSWYDDTFAPVVYAELEKVDETHLTVLFNEMVTDVSAEVVTNYTLSGSFGLSGNPVSATLAEDGKSVVLEVPDLSTITSGQTVIVTVSNVSDLMGNIVADDNIGTYTYLDEIPPVVSMSAQSGTNDEASVAVLQSNETGTVYLILESEPGTSLEDFDAAISIGKGSSATVNAANTDINVSLAGLVPGNYVAYAVDSYLNISDPSDMLVTISDITAPEVKVETQELTNAANAAGVEVETNESGTVYLILDGESQSTLLDFETAITNLKGAKAEVAYRDSSALIAMGGLNPGIYYAYAADISGNISVKSSNAVTLIEYVPRVREYTADEAAQLSADVVSANDGDVFILTTSGGHYEMAYWNRITANITIMADEDLTERPVISNYIESSTYQNFRLYSAGASLKLKGIEFDNTGNGAYPVKYVVRVASDIGAYSFVAEDCYFHGEIKSGGAIFIAYGGTHADSLIFRNCIFEGTYAIKMMGLSTENTPTWDKMEISNCTFMNIPDVVVGIADQPAMNQDMPIIMDHCTFYNVTTSETPILQSDSLAMVSVTNSILSDIPSTSPFTLFGDTDSQSKIDYFNLFNCATPLAIDNGIVGINSWAFDPLFADPNNGDLSLENIALYTLGNDGLPLGDQRWADVIAPKVLQEVSALSDSTILITFNEWIDTTTAENPLNYTISGSAGLSGTAKNAKIYNFRKVLVTTESFLEKTGEEVVITVSGVEDLQGNAVGLTDNSVTYVVEQFMPVVFADAQSVTNAAEDFVVAQGSLTGFIYIILDGVPQSTLSELDAAVLAGNGTKYECLQSYVDVQVPTFDITPGVYYAYLVDGNDGVSEKGENAITVSDGIAPIVTAQMQSTDNGDGSVVYVQSNEDNGKVYIILDGEPQSSTADFITAVALKKGATGNVTVADSDISLSTAGLQTGIYYAYAIDGAGNISLKGTSPINITQATLVINEKTEYLIVTDNHKISVLNKGAEQISEIRIFDLSGRTVEHVKCGADSFVSQPLNDGVYILHITDNYNKILTFKAAVN